VVMITPEFKEHCACVPALPDVGQDRTKLMQTLHGDGVQQHLADIRLDSLY